jgi:uncharacterized protein (TIGR02001 family)
LRKKIKLLVICFITGIFFPFFGFEIVSAYEEKNNNKFLNGNFYGYVTIASDFVFRGESETFDGDITVYQGSLGWKHNSGWYTGLFGSNIKFEDPKLDILIGPFVGKSGSLGFADLTYDLLFWSYLYPGATYSNYSELWIRVAKKIGKANFQFEITPNVDDWFGVEGWRGINYAIHPSYSFEKGLNISGSLGYQDLQGAGAEGWTHWNLGVKKLLFGLTFDLRYHDSDVDSSHLVYGSPNGQKIFDERFVIGVAKVF